MIDERKRVVMKVLLLNGSPNARGCTFSALQEVAIQLQENGVDAEIIQLGKSPMLGCVACRKCADQNQCAYGDKDVNPFAQKLFEADGLVVGSPVYYAAPNGALLSFLDRLFFSSAGLFVHKPGAAVVSARRAGTTAALDVLNKYFLIANMPLVPSQYWNMVHGNTPEEVLEDKEGLQIMRTLGKNMAWLLHCIQAGNPPPALEQRVRTNFIRLGE